MSIRDKESFSKGYMFGLFVAQTQVKLNSDKLMDAIVAIGNGELTLRPSPLDFIAEQEREFGPLPDVLKESAHRMLSQRDNDEFREMARIIYDSFGGPFK